MNDEQPDLDPQEQEQVRALLADLGTDRETLPPTVAARLDETLAGLVAEREAEHLAEEHIATGEVVPLRPRWMPRAVAAAAAVIVLGLGGVTVAANLGGSGSDSASTDAGAGGSLREETSSTAPSESAPGESATDGKSQLSGENLPQLQAATFARDVGVLLSRQPQLRAPARVQEQDKGLDSPSPTPSGDASTGAARCPGPIVTDGSTVTIAALDATPAAIVVHPPEGGKRLVEAWSCDGTRRLASTTVAP